MKERVAGSISEKERGSDRSFGMLFAVVFLIVGLYPLHLGQPLRTWALVVAGLLFVTAILYPRLLAPANRWWLRMGEGLNRVVSPLVLGIMYLVLIVPVGLAMRLAGRDVLCLKRRPEATSYWRLREEGDHRSSRFRNQF